MATESSRSILLFLVFLFSGLTYFVTLTFATVDPYFQCRCVSNIGNYTGKSAYESDLNRIFNEITSGTKLNYGFYNNYIREVNAITLCRGDVKVDNCTSCLNDAISQMKQCCPRYKEAIGWSELCMLRYSSRNISGRLEDSPDSCLLNTRSTADEYYLFVLGQLLNELRNRAAAGGNLLKYATGNSSVSASETLYAHVQCTPDLSQGDCSECLATAYEGIGSCCIGQRGCRVYRPSCNLRFELYPFIGAAAYLPPPQLPPDDEEVDRSNWIPILVASLSAALGLTMVSTCGFIIWRRRNIQEDSQNSQEVQLLDLIGGRIGNKHSRETFCGETQEFPSIQFDILHVATNHFSDENKLGQGGFGPVYKVIVFRNFYELMHA